MALVNQTERVEKEVKSLTSKILKAFKGTGGIKGELDYYCIDGIHTISLENNLGGFASAMADIATNSKYCTEVKSKEFPGWYDWKAEVYIKDASVVSFKI